VESVSIPYATSCCRSVSIGVARVEFDAHT